MYAIRVNSDNSISTIINQNIAQGYKLSDWFWIFSDQYYKDKDMTNCEAMIEFITSDGDYITTNTGEKIILNEN